MADNNTIQLVPGRKRIDNIQKYIRENIAGNLHISAIAQQFNISPSTLKRVFRQQEGQSYGQYLQQIRLIRALRLLQEEGRSVKEVMYACGYKNRSTFNTAFKQKYGYPPAHFSK